MNSTKVISYNCMYQIYSSLLPCPFTDPKMFWAVPNFLCQTSCGSHKHFVPTKRWFEFSKIVFCVGTKVFEEALNAVKFLGWLKKFGPAQNISGPVKGQGIRVQSSLLCLLCKCLFNALFDDCNIGTKTTFVANLYFFP